MATPKVSVIVPVYNRAVLLREAVESVLGQTIDSWHLLVVDDGSTEDIGGALATYRSDPRVTYHRQPNAGRCAARNTGAALAKADLLCFLDSDDRYLPDGLESLLSAFESGRDTGMAVGGYDFVDEDGSVTGSRRPWEEGSLDLEGWLVKGFAMPGSTMIRRSWFERTGGFDPAFEGGEDRGLFVRLAMAGCPMAWVRRSVTQYRKHEGNTDPRVQRDATLAALHRVFRDPELPGHLLGLEPLAYAGVHAYVAHRAAASGDDALVRECLEELAALRAEPSWRREGLLVSPQGLPAQIQYLVADVVERCELEGLDVDDELRRLAAVWGIAPRDLRRAQAHREVRAFFACLGRGAIDEAGTHRRAALRLDPRWRAYRTLLLFPLRRFASGVLRPLLSGRSEPRR